LSHVDAAVLDPLPDVEGVVLAEVLPPQALKAVTRQIAIIKI
jgi:hypothetical protein